MKIIAFSSICYDYFPEKNIAVPGGNSLNFAVQVKRFDRVDVSLAGFIGTDNAGGEILELCKRTGINTRFVVQLKGKTASNKLYLTADGERYSWPGGWQNGVKDEGIFSDETWSFIVSCNIITLPCNDRHLDELLQRKSNRNFISVDFMHFDHIDLISKYLPYINIAFVSPDIKALKPLKRLAFSSNKNIVAMLGKEGSIAFFNRKEYRHQALPVDKVVDTTGCGDAYQAGFCYAINNSASPIEAMHLATITATSVLKNYGGCCQI